MNGSVADANVGVKTVSVGTLALGDGTGLAANYTLSGGTHQLTINQRPLNATLSRQYDGTGTSEVQTSVRLMRYKGRDLNNEWFRYGC